MKLPKDKTNEAPQAREIATKKTPVLHLLPDFAHPTDAMLPVLVVQYHHPETQTTIQFSFKVTSIVERKVKTWRRENALPAVIWKGESNHLCLVFSSEEARATFLKKCESTKPVSFPLGACCRESFLVHCDGLDPSTGEVFHVEGDSHRYMSRKHKLQAFAIWDSTWTLTPTVVPYANCVQHTSTNENQLAILTKRGENCTDAYIIRSTVSRLAFYKVA